MLAFGSLDFGLESSIVLPALPVFAREYGASVIAVSWLATGFLLVGRGDPAVGAPSVACSRNAAAASRSATM